MLNFRERRGAAIGPVRGLVTALRGPVARRECSAALGTENSCHTQQNLIRQKMVLLPDWVGGRKTVVKQGKVMERGRREGGMGGGGRESERMYCMSAHAGVGVRWRGFSFSFFSSTCPCKCFPHVLPHLPQKKRN